MCPCVPIPLSLVVSNDHSRSDRFCPDQRDTRRVKSVPGAISHVMLDVPDQGSCRFQEAPTRAAAHHRTCGLGGDRCSKGYGLEEGICRVPYSQVLAPRVASSSKHRRSDPTQTSPMRLGPVILRTIRTGLFQGDRLNNASRALLRVTGCPCLSFLAVGSWCFGCQLCAQDLPRATVGISITYLTSRLPSSLASRHPPVIARDASESSECQCTRKKPTPSLS